MLSSITPLGERGRASRWGVTVAAYLVGSAVGGAALGTLLGGAGRVLPLERTGAVALLLLLAAATAWAVPVELGALGPLPTLHRQVDEDWLHRYRGWAYGVGFGLQLGTGIATIVTSPTVYAVLVLELFSGSAAVGAVVGLAFGLARGLPVLSVARITSPARLALAHRRLETWAPAGRGVAAGALAGVSVGAAAQVVLGGAALA